MKNRTAALLFCWLLAGTFPVEAEVKLPAIFSEHMVMLKSAAVPIWGQARPGEEVVVTLNGRTARGIAGLDGKWKVSLDLQECGAGPFELTVQGENKIVIADVVVGQTWLLAGQSNPERLLKETAGAPAEIAGSANPLLREFRVEKKAADTAQDDTRGKWTLASPETSANFSAIGYYFGQRLQRELQQPVGMINATWGGTFIEAWMSDEAIAKAPFLRNGEEARRKQMVDYPPEKAAYVRGFGEWLHAQNREDRPPADVFAYAGEQVSTADWTPVTLPGQVAGPGLPANGAIWLRKEIELPTSVEGIVIKASLGQTTAFESVYWNGRKIFEMPYQQLPGQGYNHYFAIPQAGVKLGEVVFAIRLFAPTLPPSILAAPEHFTVGPVSLAGKWLAKAEYSLPALSPEAAATVPQPPRQPPSLRASAIYHGVIHPIIPYGVAGVLWYQGESNAGTAYEYRTTFPLFIEDLREKWGQSGLPFYFCQLANFGPKLARPSESGWAELRESQSLALGLPDTAQAVLIDLGESGDIHARNKRDVGDRLARIALARHYGRDHIVYSGPLYRGMTAEGSKIRVEFTAESGPLVAKPMPKTYDVKTLLNETAALVVNSPGSELEGFAICGPDHHWVWADAKIEGNSVLVWSAEVPAPMAVRYAWADNPTCNLYNSAGLPASPFRTDDFPTTTDKFHFGAGPGRY